MVSSCIQCIYFRHLNCLNNNPFEIVENSIRLPVGMSWSLDEQCRLEFGAKSSHCRIVGTFCFCHLAFCSKSVACPSFSFYFGCSSIFHFSFGSFFLFITLQHCILFFVDVFLRSKTSSFKVIRRSMKCINGGHLEHFLHKRALASTLY